MKLSSSKVLPFEAKIRLIYIKLSSAKLTNTQANLDLLHAGLDECSTHAFSIKFSSNRFSTFMPSKHEDIENHSSGFMNTVLMPS